jgi:cytochrome c553
MTRYIILRKPDDLNHPRIKKEILSHYNNGCKMSEIMLQMYFVMSDEDILALAAKFKVMKNKIAFSLDTSRS